MTIRSYALIAMANLAVTGSLAQDATKTAPVNYRSQFENDYVHVVRVVYGPNETVPVHEHPKSVVAYVYLNASGVVQFRHPADGRIANRQPTTAGSFRVSRGGDETHDVVNTTATPSHFLRVEFKTDPAGDASPFFRETNKSYPAGDNATDVKFLNRQMRVTRLAIAPGKTLAQSTAAREPALFVVVTDGTLSGFRTANSSTVTAGQDRWLDAGLQTHLANGGSAPIELLRFDFLTGPRQ